MSCYSSSVHMLHVYAATKSVFMSLCGPSRRLSVYLRTQWAAFHFPYIASYLSGCWPLGFYFFRWGFHPQCSSSSHNSGGGGSITAPGHGLQVSAAQNEPVGPAPPRLQLQPPPRGPSGRLRLCAELQRVLSVLGPLGRQHPERPLQDDAPWVPPAHSHQLWFLLCRF